MAPLRNALWIWRTACHVTPESAAQKQLLCTAAEPKRETEYQSASDPLWGQTRKVKAGGWGVAKLCRQERSEWSGGCRKDECMTEACLNRLPIMGELCFLSADKKCRYDQMAVSWVQLGIMTWMKSRQASLLLNTSSYHQQLALNVLKHQSTSEGKQKCVLLDIWIWPG